MANPILPTNGTHELQERYAAEILKIARKPNFIRANHSGRIYEGDPKAGSIKIPVRDTDVVVGDYDVVAGGTLGTSATTYLSVLVNKDKYVDELIDGYEAAAVPDRIAAQRVVSAGYGLARSSEVDFLNEICTNGTVITDTTPLTESTAYKTISNAIGSRTELGIAKETLRCVITTATESLLLSDTKYTNTASQIGSERAMSGVVNMIRGVEVLVSDNLPANTEFVIYSTDYAQAGDEWSVPVGIIDLKDGKHIGASALQGRMVSWNKLTRSYGAAIKTAPTYVFTLTVDDGTDPIEGASVEIGGVTVLTNASGIAVFNLNTGDHTYIITATGYDTESGTQTIASAAASLTVSMTASA